LTRLTGTVTGIWGGLEMGGEEMMIDENDTEDPSWLDEDFSLPSFESPHFDTTSAPPNRVAMGTTTSTTTDFPPSTLDLFGGDPSASDVVGMLYERRASTSSSSVPSSSETFNIDVPFTPRVISSLPLPEISSMPLPRLKYAVSHFKTWPNLLLETGRLPYYNPQLYNPLSVSSHAMPLPLQIQDLHCIAALYTTRTPATETTVHTILESKTAQLIALPQTTLVERLAALQTLIFYQTIRLLDGDVRLRAAGEHDEPTLDAWTAELQRRCGMIMPHVVDHSKLTPPADLGIEVGAQTDPDTPWQHYLFAESIRRTILMSLMLRGIYSLLKKGWCGLSNAIQTVPWTAQKALWEAESGWRWRKAKEEKPLFQITNTEFEELWERGRVGDVDGMGLMMFVAFKGVDVVEEWIERTKDDGEGAVVMSR
jgi:hypothetical protein